MDNQETKPGGVTGSTPPPPPVTDSTTLFKLMTSDEGQAQFNEMWSKPEMIQRFASTVSSDPDNFTAIIGTRNGSSRVQMLFGISAEADNFFFAVILNRFLEIMTDQYGSKAAVRAVFAFDQEKRRELYKLTHRYSLLVACSKYGNYALSDIITALEHLEYKNRPFDVVAHNARDDLEYKNRLFDVVACNALYLSNNIYGNFVVQHVLRLNDLRTTRNVSVSLYGHCVELSFTRKGSYVVNKLLEATEESMVAVVYELLWCDGDRLVSLANNEFGNYVVSKALILTWPHHLFSFLVSKLMPHRKALRRFFGKQELLFFKL